MIRFLPMTTPKRVNAVNILLLGRANKITVTPYVMCFQTHLTREEVKAGFNHE